MTCRWGNLQLIGCIRYHVACIVENPKGQRKASIKGGAYASGLSVDLSKFCHNWATFALRDAMYHKMRLPYTQQDVFRLVHSYTFLPDLLTVITWPQMLKLMALFGGQRLKIPTLSQMEQAHKDAILFQKLQRAGHDPAVFAKTAKENDATLAAASDIFERMSQDLAEDRSGDHDIYEQ